VADEVNPVPRRVAIIGVHGVAHHDPGETANAMADLLLSLPPFDPKKADRTCAERPPREFDHFDSVGIQIPLQPVCLKKVERVDPERSKLVPPAFRLQEGSFKFALHLYENKDIGKQHGEIGRQWSVKLLQDYYGAADSNKYVTTRLEGRRTIDSTEVDIYEMFWAFGTAFEFHPEFPAGAFPVHFARSKPQPPGNREPTQSGQALEDIPISAPIRIAHSANGATGGESRSLDRAVRSNSCGHKSTAPG